MAHTTIPDSARRKLSFTFGMATVRIPVRFAKIRGRRDDDGTCFVYHYGVYVLLVVLAHYGYGRIIA